MSSGVIQFIKIRQYINKALDGLSSEQMLTIPDKFDNNIAWNLGHVIAVQQRMHYARVGATPHVSDDFIKMYLSGTSPADWSAQPNVDELVSLLTALPKKLDSNYADLSSRAFESSVTASGIPLNNLDDAINFNNYHEGQHLGFILALKNLL